MKKTLVKVLTLALVAVMLVCAFASCGGSTYDDIEANFKDAGYEVLKSDSEEVKEAEEEFEALDLDVKIHLLQKNDETGVVILEFDDEEALEEAEKNQYIKAMLEMYKAVDEDAKFVRDNCILIPGSMDADEIKDMIKIFNK